MDGEVPQCASRWAARAPLRTNATASFGALGRCVRAYKTRRRRLASVWSLSRSRGLTMNASAPDWRLLFSYSGLPLTTTIAVFFAESDFIRRHTCPPQIIGLIANSLMPQFSPSDIRDGDRRESKSKQRDSPSESHAVCSDIRPSENSHPAFPVRG
jgi:hypothetical protein